MKNLKELLNNSEIKVKSKSKKICAVAILTSIIWFLVMAFLFVNIFAHNIYNNGDNDNNEENEITGITEATKEDNITMNIESVLLQGETLYVEVSDIATGETRIIELPFADYVREHVNSAENTEFINIQVMDADGGRSNTVRIRNPGYAESETENTENEEQNEETGEHNEDEETGEAEIAITTVSGIPNTSSNSFTPDGQGTVLDNLTNADQIEFFSISTPENNIFYLVVDRQRGRDNVYLLNPVTEHDLIALAEADSNQQTVSGIPSAPNPEPSPNPETAQTPSQTAEPETPAVTGNGSNGNGGNLLLILIIAVSGAAAGFFKIRKRRAENQNSDDNGEDDGDEYESE